MIVTPALSPASTYADALERVRAIQARDDDRVAPNARTALLTHGERRPWSIVLFHGLTNHPGQFVELAPKLAALGVNVLAPRMPYHGYRDRLTADIAKLTAEELVAASHEAVDVAAGLGERVAVLGISMGGLQCAYLAQTRSDIATSMPIGPDFGLLQLPHAVTQVIGWLGRHAPNLFLWWDPRVRADQRPRTAYPRFSTHALMQTLRISDLVYKASKQAAPQAARVATVVNRTDPAVNNEVTLEIVRQWQAMRSRGVEFHELQGLPMNHDIIDPDNPLAKTEIVYPKLIDLLALHS
jgi:carboxylesterase